MFYVQVPSLEIDQSPDESLKLFTDTFPIFNLLGTRMLVKPENPYFIDEEVQLVCKYLKALKDKSIDTLYKGKKWYIKSGSIFSTNIDDRKVDMDLSKFGGASVHILSLCMDSHLKLHFTISLIQGVNKLSEV